MTDTETQTETETETEQEQAIYLKLQPDTAAVLRRVLECIGGDPKGPRGHVDAVLLALTQQCENFAESEQQLRDHWGLVATRGGMALVFRQKGRRTR